VVQSLVFFSPVLIFIFRVVKFFLTLHTASKAQLQSDDEMLTLYPNTPMFSAMIFAMISASGDRCRLCQQRWSGEGQSGWALDAVFILHLSVHNDQRKANSPILSVSFSRAFPLVLIFKFTAMIQVHIKAKVRRS
jgi:hypothetical protein